MIAVFDCESDSVAVQVNHQAGHMTNRLPRSGIVPPGRMRWTAGLAFFLSATGAALQAEPIVHRSKSTGQPSFISLRAEPQRTAGVSDATARAVLKGHGALLGIASVDEQLRLMRLESKDTLGYAHATYEQVHRGVPVFASVLKVHFDAAGRAVSINGHFRAIPDSVNVQPARTEAEAVAAAREEFGHPDALVDSIVLEIVDPGWYGDPPIGARPAYRVVLARGDGAQAESFFVDAHSAEVLDRWSLNPQGLHREIYDAMGTANLGALVRTEGGAPVGSPMEANQAYDYAGDFHGYFLRGFGRDSVDGGGLPLIASVNSTDPSSCPNAFWSNQQHYAAFCAGMAVDDVIAHEYAHGLTEFTANLVYQNQSGQLNESFSDIFGELVDLFNGDAGFAGPPGGTPWPAHQTGEGGDLPNASRGDACMHGVSVRVDAPASLAQHYVARAVANLGPRLTTGGVTGEAVMATPITACPAGSPLQNPGQMAGKVCVINVDGGCSVVAKATNCQDAGAIAVIIANVAAGTPASLNGIDNRIVIPLVTVAMDDGDLLKAGIAAGPVTVTLLANTPGASVRWLVGEDFLADGIRDMWNPRCHFNPDTANSAMNTCGESDLGGVHSGSGVMNHAFAIATDGAMFNGLTIPALGPIKTGAVWYRALTAYLTPAADFEDAFVALSESALDLVGTNPVDPRTGTPSGAMFTSQDAGAIVQALQAVEMDSPGRCGASDEVLSALSAPLCPQAQVLFGDDFESGVGGWTVAHTGPSGPPTAYDWVQTVEPLPGGRSGTAWFCADPDIGDCAAQDETAVHSLFSPVFVLPMETVAPMLAFAHFMESAGYLDGGNVKLQVNGGPWQLIPRTACRFNAYNGRFVTAAQGNTGALSGQDAWLGSGGTWGTSLLSLNGMATGGDNVALRFDFGKNGCGGLTGWYVDDVTVFDCPDCNGDGTADGEELRFASASPVLANFGTGVVQNHVLPNPPLATGDVHLSFTAQGDLRGTTEFVTVDINGTVVGTVFSNHASDCFPTPDAESLSVPAAVFNLAKGGGDAVIRMVGSAAVDPVLQVCGGQTYITSFVEYPIGGDLDGDSDADLADVGLFQRCFRGAAIGVDESCRSADLNSDTRVDLDDFPFMSGTMGCPH